MELWIRSQDKNILTKIDTLRIGVNDIFTKGDLANIWGNDIFALGGYKTKERALEVLDEIQNIIKPTFLNTKYNCEIKDGHNKNEFDLVMQPDESKIEIIQPTTIVYEMPEE